MFRVILLLTILVAPFACEQSATHVPVPTPSDKPKDNLPPNLPPKPLPPV
jgi:hypothetical protein